MVTYKFNQNVAKRFMDLSINKKEEPENVPLTYVWIDGTGQSLRSKTRTIKCNNGQVILETCPEWSFCATGTGFETEEITENGEKRTDSSCVLRPCALYWDPFHGQHARLVLCEVYYNGKPVKTNNRKECFDVLEKFGIEQEYTLIDPKTNRPLGWPEDGFPAPQGPYYCGVGTGLAIGRDIAEAHYRACLAAGIPIYGYNAEVMPGQWEFQVGECEGINMGDDLWMARFILVRMAEEFGVKVSFDPKPVEGDWNGTGAHINVSTSATKGEGGYGRVLSMIKELEEKHKEAIAIYDPNQGKDNARRLTGKHETCKIDQFKFSIDDRGASIRLHKSPEVSGEITYYFEDRSLYP
uniref:glutamine synthetase n=1 Tax=Tetranychus urticae TaxID=32264 RepID=T1JQ53_TETUR